MTPTPTPMPMPDDLSPELRALWVDVYAPRPLHISTGPCRFENRFDESEASE